MLETVFIALVYVVLAYVALLLLLFLFDFRAKRKKRQKQKRQEEKTRTRNEKIAKWVFPATGVLLLVSGIGFQLADSRSTRVIFITLFIASALLFLTAALPFIKGRFRK